MQKMRACTIIYLLGMKEGENSTRDTFEKILASFEAAELVGECIYCLKIIIALRLNSLTIC